MAITTGLYPPIVADTMPAFIRSENCKVYFSLSMYNSRSDINGNAVQVSLINQRTNISAFKKSIYPSGIKLATLYKDNEIQGDYNYYIIISPNDLEEGSFGLNQFYKVQLRFTSIQIQNVPNNENGRKLDTWLYDNMQYFSEWSKVCLIKGIATPKIFIRGFDDIEKSQETILTDPIIDIIGELRYEDGIEEQEYLKSYNIKLYYANDLDNLLMQSEEIYTNPYNPNEINYQLTYDIVDGIEYIIFLTYTTNNLYSNSVSYNFTVVQYGADILKADITAIPDEQNGRIQINIVSKNAQRFLGNLTIRRTSSKSNFHKWEDVKTVTYLNDTSLNFIWYDTTIQSGVWYKYCAQKRNSHGSRGVIIQINNPVMCLLDDIFLTKENCQLKIRFNPTLNEFKYNVTESQQITIGAKYPYIKRNGNNYFRTFSIGGLISSFLDTTDWYDPHYYEGAFHNNENEIKAFTSKADIYGESQQLYNNYNQIKNITQYNDYIYEREFREKVYDFLYKHDVKLFRSTTEGNILIKLTNINFQPIESLGRRLYSFTATAIQVDEATISNYEKYGIQTVGNYSKYIMYQHEIIGRISGTYNENDQNILETKIGVKYKNSANKGFINEISNLKWLKLEIESDPYLIIEQDGRLIKATKDSIFQAANATIGHIVTINDKDIIIYPRLERRPTGSLSGREFEQNEKIKREETNNKIEITNLSFFELKENNTLIKSLKFKYPTTVSIEYKATLQEKEDTSIMPSKIYYNYKVGQLYGTFNPNDSLVQKIYNKYALKYTKYYQQLLNVIDVKIEGPQGAVIYIKDSKDSDFNRHILENGFLQLKDNEVMIEDLYFNGINLTLNEGENFRDNKYTLIEEQYNLFEEIENPIPNGVYQINNSKYIYYHNNWYPFTSENDVICPVDGLIDYYCEVMKGVYSS